MILSPTRIFGHTALTYAQEIALVNYERNRRFTFKELHELTNKVCNMLSDEFKLVKGNVFGTILENDNMGLLYLTMMKSECTSLWLGMMDSIEEHLYQIDFVRPSVIFIEKHLLEQYYDPLSQRNIDMVVMDKPDTQMKDVYDFWELLEKSSPEDPDTQVVADDANKHCCLLKFTGGTTGRGKCAMYSVSNFLSSGTNMSYGDVFPHEKPKVLLSTPITHAAGSMVIPAYFKGGAVITLNRADIEVFCKAIEKERVELIYTVPTVLYRMVDMGLTEKYDLSSLKTVRYGASPIAAGKLEELIKQFGKIFMQGYASTESWIPGTILNRNEHDASTEVGRKRLKSVGRPAPGVEIKIVDTNGKETSIDEEGEILVRGPHTIVSYYNDPEQTKEGFTEDGFWKSGDIGYRDADGFIYLIDRKKDMIVSGGFNVYATEVENCINSHPSVQQSAVVGLPDEIWGEAVHGEVILNKGASLSEEELIKYCKANLSRYKVPKSIKFVEELPLSAVGKILRREVRKRYQ